MKQSKRSVQQLQNENSAIQYFFPGSNTTKAHKHTQGGNGLNFTQSKELQLEEQKRQRRTFSMGSTSSNFDSKFEQKEITIKALQDSFNRRAKYLDSYINEMHEDKPSLQGKEMDLSMQSNKLKSKNSYEVMQEQGTSFEKDFSLLKSRQPIKLTNYKDYHQKTPSQIKVSTPSSTGHNSYLLNGWSSTTNKFMKANRLIQLSSKQEDNEEELFIENTQNKRDHTSNILSKIPHSHKLTDSASGSIKPSISEFKSSLNTFISNEMSEQQYLATYENDLSQDRENLNRASRSTILNQKIIGNLDCLSMTSKLKLKVNLDEEQKLLQHNNQRSKYFVTDRELSPPSSQHRYDTFESIPEENNVSKLTRDQIAQMNSFNEQRDNQIKNIQKQNTLPSSSSPPLATLTTPASQIQIGDTQKQIFKEQLDWNDYLSHEIKVKQNLMKERSSQLEQINQNLKTQSNHFTEQQSLREKVREEMMMLRQQLEIVEKERLSQEQRKKEIVEEIDKAQKELIDTQGQVKLMRNLIDQLIEQRQKIEQDITDKKGIFEEKKKEIEILHSQRDEVEKEIKSFKDKIRDYNIMDKKIIEREEQIQMNQLLLKQREDACKAKEDKIEAKIKEIANFRESIEQQQNNLENEKQILQEQGDNLSRQEIQLMNNQKELSDSRNHLQVRENVLCQNENYIKQQFNKFNQDTEELNIQIKQLQILKQEMHKEKQEQEKALIEKERKLFDVERGIIMREQKVDQQTQLLYDIELKKEALSLNQQLWDKRCEIEQDHLLALHKLKDENKKGEKNNTKKRNNSEDQKSEIRNFNKENDSLFFNKTNLFPPTTAKLFSTNQEFNNQQIQQQKTLRKSVLSDESNQQNSINISFKNYIRK